ncbi:hypothetical protein [Arthrobacter sp. Soil762]|uniref:hypothetical protein n=1 Tax=Arthrobacter sp. Soil762 TaxID=1736401 RepID=UPI0006F3B14B|nr:hypothetical protein [Arthrobacter sp. Soil762]KRE74526.1 hypothetical protein ASG77_07440 [Arthrobacter sp. Soil762]
MITDKVQTVRIQLGDHIEAWHNGKLFHKGRVTDVVHSLELIWIRDARTGKRKLLDPEALEIIKVAAPQAAG